MEDTVGYLGPHLQVKTIRMWELLRNTGAPNPCNGADSPNGVEGVFSEVRKRGCLVTAVSWYTDNN